MKPPLTWLKIVPVTVSFFSKHLFEADPALLAARLLARQHRLAERVLDALQIDLDLVAGIEHPVLAADAEFLQRHPALDLQADIDDRDVLLDGDDRALDDGAFGEVAAWRRILPGGRRNPPLARLRLRCLHRNSLIGPDYPSPRPRAGRFALHLPPSASPLVESGPAHREAEGGDLLVRSGEAAK